MTTPPTVEAIRKSDLTSAQRRVLKYMARNHTFVCCSIGIGPAVWFAGGPGYRGSLRFNTMQRLEELKIVERRNEQSDPCQRWEWHVTDGGEQVVITL